MSHMTGQPWTPDAEEALATLYASGWRDEDIAERLGRSKGAIRDRITRLRNMGLLSSINPNPTLARPKSTPIETVKYLPVEEACAYHAAVVMSQGGFCALSEKRIGKNTWAVCLPLVWPKKELTR